MGFVARKPDFVAASKKGVDQLHSLISTFLIHTRHLIKSLYKKFNFLISHLGTQKNRLNETVLFSINNICCWVRKYLQFNSQKLCLSKQVSHPVKKA